MKPFASSVRAGCVSLSPINGLKKNEIACGYRHFVPTALASVTLGSIAVFIVTCLCISAQVRKASTAKTALVLVANLYKEHDAKHSPFFQTKNRALVDKYFDKNLAGLIWKDAVNSKGEVGLLDFDPLYDAQDTDIKNFSVVLSRGDNGKAEVTVSFKNFGKRVKMLFFVTENGSAWRISDLQYEDGRTLVGILKGA